MVRLLNKNNIGFLTNTLYSILKIQEKMTNLKNFNNPDIRPCIYAIWHANQFMVHGFKGRNDINVLISNSLDGEIVAKINENWGYHSIRGSSNKKGAVEATMQMIEKLKKGESVVIMVDGPNGPLHTVKNGAIKLAQKTGVPIVPAFWYSPDKTFVSFPSWDKIKLPVGFCRILNVYGRPIHVKEELTDEEFKAIKEEIKNQIDELEKNSPKYFEEALKDNLWKK